LDEEIVMSEERMIDWPSWSIALPGFSISRYPAVCSSK